MLVLAWLAIGVLPGLLIVLGLRPRGEWLVSFALAPLVSYGALMTVAVIETTVGLEVTPMTVLLPVAVMSVCCIGWGWNKQQHAWNLRRSEGIALLITVLVSATIWLAATRGLSVLPPNDDGSNHGLFATQIARLHTITPSLVVVGDVISGQPNSPYYPLAMHLQAALASTLSGAPVAVALNLQLVAAVCALPVGFFLLTRLVFPQRPGAAVIASIFALTFPVMPYFVASWGGYPFIVGISFTAVAVVAMISPEGNAASESALIGLILIALFAVHPSELVSALSLVALLVVGRLARHQLTVRASAPLALGFGILAAFVGLQWSNIVAGTENIAVAALIPPQSFVDSVRNSFVYVVTVPEGEAGPNPAWLTVSALVLWLLALIGVATALRRRWSIEWVIGLALVVVVTIASAMRSPLVDLITVPWYSRWDRVVINELFFLAPLAALGVCTLAARADRRRQLVAGGVCAAVAVPAIITCSQVVATSYSVPNVADADARTAFQWLALHQRAGERVLNDPSEGSSWMWALQSVPPLFATAPHQIDGWGDRLYLRDHAPQISTDRKVAAIADQWAVRYAYVGPWVFARHQEHIMTVDEYTRLGGWRVVFTSGNASVLERVVN